MTNSVTFELRDGIAVLSIDDGKANALSFDVLAALDAGLDRAEAENAGAVVLVGRAGMFSGGFDLSVMRGGDPKAVGGLVTSGAELVLRLYGSGRPIVAACTGHAVAAGAFVLMGAHHRVGAEGAFRICLIETQIGMVLPDWAVELTNERLVGFHAQQAAIESRVYDPGAAVEAGFLDRVGARGRRGRCGDGGGGATGVASGGGVRRQRRQGAGARARAAVGGRGQGPLGARLVLGVGGAERSPADGRRQLLVLAPGRSRGLGEAADPVPVGVRRGLGERHPRGRDAEPRSRLHERILEQLGLGGVEQPARRQDPLEGDAPHAPADDEADVGGAVAVDGVGEQRRGGVRGAGGRTLDDGRPLLGLGVHRRVVGERAVVALEAELVPTEDDRCSRLVGADDDGQRPPELHPQPEGSRRVHGSG